MSSVSLEGVRKFYGKLEAIKGISLEIADHELIVFVGPSGCGKSTLLRMIAGLEDVDYGTVRIGGDDVTEVAPAQRGLAMVFQNYALYPHMSAFNNMAYGLRRAGMRNDLVRERVTAAAELLQIQQLMPRLPREMSGGQRQRVAIGRAIVRKPRVFLFDEPLSNLDAALRLEMRTQIAKLHVDLNATMIFVTHDQVEAMTLADRIVVLRDGVIEQVGSPLDVYRRPANLFVASFIGSPAMNLLSARVAANDPRAPSLLVEDGSRRLTLAIETAALAIGQPVTLGLRPEALRIVATDVAALEGRARVVEQLGAESVIHFELSSGKSLVLRTGGSTNIKVGDVVGIGFDPTAASLFAEDGANLGVVR